MRTLPPTVFTAVGLRRGERLNTGHQPQIGFICVNASFRRSGNPEKMEVEGDWVENKSSLCRQCRRQERFQMEQTAQEGGPQGKAERKSRKSLAKRLCEAGALGVGGRMGWAVEDWRKTQHIQNTVIQAVASIRVTTNANRPGAEKHTVQLETAGLLVQGNSLFDNPGSGPTVRKKIKQCKIKSLTKPEFLN